MRIEASETAELVRPQHDRFADPMVMPSRHIRRYDHPRENTIFPREYLFHLLGDLPGRTVVDLACGEGLNTVILAALGARVISVDNSDKHLGLTAERACANGVAARVELLRWESAAIPVDASQADHVLCNGVFNQADPVVTARQIRRILKPGGTAVFETPLALPGLLAAITGSHHENDRESGCHSRQRLTRGEIEAACRAVGLPGRGREFWLVTPLLSGNNGMSAGPARWTHRLDARLLSRFQFARRFAASLVWEARKES